jgi:hypothetical protein
MLTTAQMPSDRSGQITRRRLLEYLKAQGERDVTRHYG